MDTEDNAGFDSDDVYAFAQYRFSDRTTLSMEATYFKYLAQQAGGLTDAQFAENPKQGYQK